MNDAEMGFLSHLAAFDCERLARARLAVGNDRAVVTLEYGEDDGLHCGCI